MIRKIRSKLSVKVFLITAALLAACCGITYLCIVRFAPYIYSHELVDAEDLTDSLALEISYTFPHEAEYLLAAYQDIIAEEYGEEFILHMFQDNGGEVLLPGLNAFTGRKLEDYENVETTVWRDVCFQESTKTYTLFLTKNTHKESQVVEALEKSLPLLSVIVFAVSVTAAFFYAWYITRPIKKISRWSKRIAAMDLSGLCPVSRTDEIGVLSQSLNDLSGKLTAALSELQDANEKLQADIDKERLLERQRAEFFSAASHELKTPITIIKGQLQGMLYQVGRYKDREAYLAQSLEVTDTLEKMVQELLTISRLDAPGYTCSKSNLNFSAFLEEKLKSYEDLFMQKGLTLEKSILPEVFLDGDPWLLQKVLDNLLGNAAAYSGAGNTVFVRLWKEEGRINFTVENTGVRIPEEDIPRLFEAFYRVDPSRNRQTGGTGLGLYIVKTILDLHDAKVRIANSVYGVVVTVRF